MVAIGIAIALGKIFFYVEMIFLGHCLILGYGHILPRAKANTWCAKIVRLSVVLRRTPHYTFALEGTSAATYILTSIFSMM